MTFLWPLSLTGLLMFGSMALDSWRSRGKRGEK